MDSFEFCPINFFMVVFLRKHVKIVICHPYALERSTLKDKFVM